MNSRTIHSVLLFSIVSVFFITGAHVHAQNLDNLEKKKTTTIISQPTYTSSDQVSTQLPILLSDVGETVQTKATNKTLLSATSPSPTTKPKNKQTTPTSNPTPTKAPDNTPTPQFSQSEATHMTNSGGLNPEKLFSMSNEYRKLKGLPEFKKDEKTCALAASRAPEVAAEVASGNMHKGLRDRNLDYWNTENIISMRTEESAFNWWINDKIHHDAIVGNFIYSCVACSGNNCAQEFTNYQAK